MTHIYSGASPFGRAPRIRALLERAHDIYDSSAHFWALAVASQLIEEHITTLEDCLTRSRHPAQRARCRRVLLAWMGCLVTICIRLDREPEPRPRLRSTSRCPTTTSTDAPTLSAS